jgi:hypothetical protein
MTHQQIKASKQAGNSNWEILSQVIAAGYEYSDAVYRVAEALCMKSDERACMERDYDEIC